MPDPGPWGRECGNSRQPLPKMVQNKNDRRKKKLNDLKQQQQKSREQTIRVDRSFNPRQREQFEEVRKLATRSTRKPQAINQLKSKSLIASSEDMGAYIKEMENKLNTIGDDAQLATIELQNALQRQQQILQTMSNISKMLHDSAVAIIRKIG
jgi:hypothetical protein